MREKQFLSKHLIFTIAFIILVYFIFFYSGIPENYSEFVGSILLFFLSLMLHFSIHLDFLIKDKTIKYRFFPFQWKYRTLDSDDIMYYIVKDYNFFTYGGLGQKINFVGTAFVVKGKKAFTLYLKNGQFSVFSIKDVEKAKVLLGIEKYREQIHNP